MSTHVYLDGEPLDGVSALKFEMECDGKPSRLTLTILGADLILHGSFEQPAEPFELDDLDIDGILGDDYPGRVIEECPSCGERAETTALNAARSDRGCPRCGVFPMKVVSRLP